MPAPAVNTWTSPGSPARPRRARLAALSGLAVPAFLVGLALAGDGARAAAGNQRSASRERKDFVTLEAAKSTYGRLEDGVPFVLAARTAGLGYARRLKTFKAEGSARAFRVEAVGGLNLGRVDVSVDREARTGLIYSLGAGLQGSRVSAFGYTVSVQWLLMPWIRMDTAGYNVVAVNGRSVERATLVRYSDGSGMRLSALISNDHDSARERVGYGLRLAYDRVEWKSRDEEARFADRAQAPVTVESDWSGRAVLTTMSIGPYLAVGF